VRSPARDAWEAAQEFEDGAEEKHHDGEHEPVHAPPAPATGRIGGGVAAFCPPQQQPADHRHGAIHDKKLRGEHHRKGSLSARRARGPKSAIETNFSRGAQRPLARPGAGRTVAPKKFAAQ
jgi:hypothetical protein